MDKNEDIESECSMLFNRFKNVDDIKVDWFEKNMDYFVQWVYSIITSQVTGRKILFQKKLLRTRSK